ncbi:hypothetical protein ACS0TY_021573 [Phlomoides rotata]
MPFVNQLPKHLSPFIRSTWTSSLRRRSKIFLGGTIGLCLWLIQGAVSRRILEDVVLVRGFRNPTVEMSVVIMLLSL